MPDGDSIVKISDKGKFSSFMNIWTSLCNSPSLKSTIPLDNHFTPVLITEQRKQWECFSWVLMKLSFHNGIQHRFQIDLHLLYCQRFLIHAVMSPLHLACPLVNSGCYTAVVTCHSSCPVCAGSNTLTESILFDKLIQQLECVLGCGSGLQSWAEQIVILSCISIFISDVHLQNCQICNIRSLSQLEGIVATTFDALNQCCFYIILHVIYALWHRVVWK